MLGRVYLKSVVRPAAKFHITFLIIEGEPRDIDLARTLEYSRWYKYTATIAVNHHVGCVRAVEAFVSAKTHQFVVNNLHNGSIIL